ncbi:MAG: hypothetical protein C3F19_05745 [Rhodocyclales bacterium]|nr:MAG: hypothetical protein C3F19_05745 [Rhodocyclales bacterium]
MAYLSLHSPMLRMLVGGRLSMGLRICSLKPLYRKLKEITWGAGNNVIHQIDSHMVILIEFALYG